MDIRQAIKRKTKKDINMNWLINGHFKRVVINNKTTNKFTSIEISIDIIGIGTKKYLLYMRRYKISIRFFWHQS